MRAIKHGGRITSPSRLSRYSFCFFNPLGMLPSKGTYHDGIIKSRDRERIAGKHHLDGLTATGIDRDRPESSMSLIFLLQTLNIMRNLLPQ